MINYRYIRARYKPEIFETEKPLKKGIWVPLSIASYISGYTNQNLRVLCYQGFIKSAKFKVGPMLVEINSISDYKRIKKSMTSGSGVKTSA
jgi:hypothetical protein